MSRQTRDTVRAIETALAEELRSAWREASDDWDALVADESGVPNQSPVGIWGGMPVVDSKAIARMAPLFEKHLGKKLDVRLIRPGGYESIGSAIADLVPKMSKRAFPSSTKSVPPSGQEIRT